MKRLLILLIVLICTSIAFAENYNAAQEALRKDIAAYLQKKGLRVDMQDDGLKFKSEGTTYYIEISDSNTDPMYLRICLYLSYGEKLTRANVLQKLNDYNVKYCVKVTCLEKSLLISAEMFVGKSVEFTYAFDDLFNQLKATYDIIN